MRFLYLPYRIERDEETASICVIGTDSRGEDWGVGAGATLQEAERWLRAWILDCMEAAASDGNDLTGDLSEASGTGDVLMFAPSELIPVHLKLARARAKLRQADMAERLGITQQAYAKLERPGANPTLQTLIQLERVLGHELVAWAR
ncbi:MAG: helix-turn-helix transcriptional regulator [Holophaga sp.]|nr:helix-turn-helix transcriptional regulator [Holophaga sp.]